MRLVLSATELQLVTFVGTERARAAQGLGRRRLAGLPNPEGGADLWNDCIGAAAEYAVAKSTGKFWNALADDVRKDVLRADVGDDLHVKAITSRAHNLIVKKDDPRFGWYVLCHVSLPAVEILGCFRAGEITEAHWRPNLPVPAYLIPQSALIHREAVAA